MNPLKLSIFIGALSSAAAAPVHEMAKESPPPSPSPSTSNSVTMSYSDSSSINHASDGWRFLQPKEKVLITTSAGLTTLAAGLLSWWWFINNRPPPPPPSPPPSWPPVSDTLEFLGDGSCSGAASSTAATSPDECANTCRRHAVRDWPSEGLFAQCGVIAFNRASNGCLMYLSGEWGGTECSALNEADAGYKAYKVLPWAPPFTQLSGYFTGEGVNFNARPGYPVNATYIELPNGVQLYLFAVHDGANTKLVGYTFDGATLDGPTLTRVDARFIGTKLQIDSPAMVLYAWELAKRLVDTHGTGNFAGNFPEPDTKYHSAGVDIPESGGYEIDQITWGVQN